MPAPDTLAALLVWACLLWPREAVCSMAARGGPCGGGGGPAETGSAGTGSAECSGEVRFREVVPGALCLVEWDLRGCGAAGLRGLHIHESADFSRGCESAGPHYNPWRRRHGGPGDAERHVGDLGNVRVDASGRARGRLLDRLVRLRGPTSVVGRSVVLHAGEDDLGRGGHPLSSTTGNAGPRVACGEICAAS